MKKLKVIIAERSGEYRNILARSVEQTGLAVVTKTASSGQMALERLKQEPADFLLLSISIPEEKPLETLVAAKKNYPDLIVATVCIAEKSEPGALAAAARLGSSELLSIFSEKSIDYNVEFLRTRLRGIFTQAITRQYTGSALKGKISEQALSTVKTKQQGKGSKPNLSEITKKPFSSADLVLIAASTGGPLALRKVMSGLSGSINIPIMIVQHMPKEFTGKLAHSLDKDCVLDILEAVEGLIVKPKQALLAPGGIHMTVTYFNHQYKVKLVNSPPVNGVKPAADVLFESVARVYKSKRILTVILTGMGSDSLAGVRELKANCNCYCLVQSEKSCVIFGMPGNIVRAGLADEMIDIDGIANRVNSILIPGLTSKRSHS